MGASGPDLSELADQLVAAARTSGIELTGPAGLLTGLTKQVLETALDVELTEHLGYDRHERTGGGGNVRNGSTAKTVRTDVGDVRITVPRDRAGLETHTFALLPPWRPRSAGGGRRVRALARREATTDSDRGAKRELTSHPKSRALRVPLRRAGYGKSG
jgi:putative transposase